jgi:hypothetical protein
MRMTTHPPIELKTPQYTFANFRVETGPRLTATFAMFLFSFLALPINAQSASSLGDHATDVRFASRLHDRLNWQAGFEFPLFGDSITCPHESDADLAARASETAEPTVEESSDLEHEILRSISEIFQEDYCEAYASIWQPALVAEPSKAIDSNLLRAADIIDWTNGLSHSTNNFGMWIQNHFDGVLQFSHEWIASIPRLESEFVASQPGDAIPTKTDTFNPAVGNTQPLPFLIQPKYPTLGWPHPAFQKEIPRSTELEADLFWEVFSSHLKSVGREIEYHSANLFERLCLNSSETIDWLDLQIVQASNMAQKRWNQLVAREQSVSVQPVATASYVGLERAIFKIQSLVSKQFGQWRASGKLVASSSRKLVKLQNETFERVVLRQFDAILR